MSFIERGEVKYDFMKNEYKRFNFLALRYTYWIRKNVGIISVFMEIWGYYFMSKKTKCVVFQKINTTVTFEQYFTYDIII